MLPEREADQIAAQSSYTEDLVLPLSVVPGARTRLGLKAHCLLSLLQPVIWM